MDSNLDLSSIRGCHCLAARKRAREITRIYERRLRLHGLRASQFSVLAALTIKGATPLRELADLLGLERTTLTRIAAPLQRDGFIRTAEQSDARVRILRVTDAGRRKLERAYPAWREAQDLIDQQALAPAGSLQPGGTSAPIGSKA